MSKIIVIIVFFLVSVTDVHALRRKTQPEDTVSIGCRGVMESFRKVHEGIGERLDFYASQGFTHYFYSPSDDRYCNRWGWKFLYNDSDRHQVRRLAVLCGEKGMDFVWTVNPGERFSGTPEDYRFLLDKLVMMYYNGIRSFAVALPESAGDYTAVRDSLVKDFVSTRQETVSLYMIADIPSVDYPVEGTDAASVLIRGYHFDAGFIEKAEKADAVLCNISVLDEFAKLAVIAVADCSRNAVLYSPDRSMADGIAILGEELKDAIRTFQRHAGERNDACDTLTFTVDEWSEDKSAALYDEFDRIEKAPLKLREYSGTEVVTQLLPWFEQLRRLGTRGKKVLECMGHYKAGRLGDFWLAYLSACMTEDEMLGYQAHPVGEKLLHPFCCTALEDMKGGFTSMLTGGAKMCNLASTLYTHGAALDSDIGTCVSSQGHAEFAVPVSADTCHLLTGRLDSGQPVIFRQLGSDGRLLAEFVLESSFCTFDIKDGTVKVDVLGDVDIYETIFVDLHL